MQRCEIISWDIRFNLHHLARKTPTSAMIFTLFAESTPEIPELTAGSDPRDPRTDSRKAQKLWGQLTAFFTGRNSVISHTSKIPHKPTIYQQKRNAFTDELKSSFIPIYHTAKLNDGYCMKAVQSFYWFSQDYRQNWVNKVACKVSG